MGSAGYANSRTSFSISDSTLGNSALVSLSGEFDITAAPALQESLRRQPSGQVTVDMAAVTFLDCCSVGVILAELGRLGRCGGKLTVTNPSTVVTRLLSIVDPSGTALGFDKPLRLNASLAILEGNS